MSKLFDPMTVFCAECQVEVDIKKAVNFQSESGGKWMCDDCHYKTLCSKCDKEVPYSKQVGCAWGDDGHEEEVFCSENCMNGYHDGPEDDPREER